MKKPIEDLKIPKMEKHLHRVRMRCIKSEAGQVNDGAKSARIIQGAFNPLSEFKLNSIGTEATTGYVEGLIPSSPNLDFEILKDGHRIAQLEVTGSNYTFKGSKIMPIHIYKGHKIMNSKEPIYIVFWMKNEPGAVKDCCYWIRGEDVVKRPIRTITTKYKPIPNYMTDKVDWHQGLESLIEELKRLILEGT